MTSVQKRSYVNLNRNSRLDNRRRGLGQPPFVHEVCGDEEDDEDEGDRDGHAHEGGGHLVAAREGSGGAVGQVR